SGLKTSFLYTLRDAVKQDPDFVSKNPADLAASLQATIIDILLAKLRKAVEQTGVRTVAIGGGVSANSGVRQAVADFCAERGLEAFIPERAFTTDNAAMVAMAGYFKYLDGDFCRYDQVPFARVTV
ncbi:MAG: tRNA (adenosine(37)-N6)-threonylcarbamoyltransferase complex transferase subunit TsaD, partial [Muribaculaceae bacterium]|nr:tRNA (adenosine(37)-N6)-threonylcarbamoyltransferase complex transferase subunit TsaD [Muribaculaceae bacterium]